MKLVLSGGGTGGHVYPALAIAEAFAQEPSFAPFEALFVGTRERLEAQIVPSAGMPIAFVHAAPLARRLSLSIFSTIVTNARGFVEALGVLHRARPDVLIATGGYVALPVVAALRFVRALGRSKARIALLEPNAVAGLTNRLLTPLVDEVWLAVVPPGRVLGKREHLVGTPVRAAVRVPMTPAEGRRLLEIDPLKTTIVIMGGSQGARSLNDAATGLVDAGLPPGWQLVIVAGERDFERVGARLSGRPSVRVLSYLREPRAAYAAADVLVTRAGASTLAELAATAVPALLVPYPHASDDHQMHNAYAYAQSGSARVLADAALDPARLEAEVRSMLDVLPALQSAARRAAQSDPRAAIVARVKAWSAANGIDP